MKRHGRAVCPSCGSRTFTTTGEDGDLPRRIVGHKHYETGETCPASWLRVDGRVSVPPSPKRQTPLKPKPQPRGIA